MPRVIHKQRASMFDTLNAMRAAALEGKKDLAVRQLVEKILSQVTQGDYSSEVLAIYYWACQNIRYLRDPDGVEFLRIPRELLKARTGDCDDIATLLAAMLMAAGNPVRIVIASFKPGQPSFSHVYVEVMTPQGPITIDPVANRDTGKMLGAMKVKEAFPLSQGPGSVDAGIGGPPARHIGPKGGNVYSVFDYYEAQTGPLPATGRYRKLSSSKRLGAIPEAMAATLPGGARKIGEGSVARGMIASRLSGLDGLDLPSLNQLAFLGAGILVGIYGYRMWTRRRR